MPEEPSTLDGDEQAEQANKVRETEILEYVSVRITTPKIWSDIENIVNGFEWYISYPHVGKNGNNPHFHFAVPGGKRVLERVIFRHVL
jgi:hypothetical protein